MNNLQEQAADTDPNSASSILKLTTVQVVGGQITLAWQGGQSAKQILKQANQLTGPWNPIFTNPPPTVVSNSITIPQAGSTSGFYRIDIAP
jgi:hypothetical protein